MSDQPNSTFRPSMNWVHTWAGLLLGTLIFTVFWMGTLSVFDHEIDRWMQPSTRIVASAAPVDFDAMLESVRAEFPEREITEAGFAVQSERAPLARGYFAFAGGERETWIVNPETGERLAEPGSLAGTGFIYPMHICLLLPGIWGWWLVLIAAIAMMLLVVTGVIVHRKIIMDFFTFRQKKKLRRSSLDLHNLAGTLFLPFHFMIAFSGVMIFAGWYTSLVWLTLPGEAADRATILANAGDDYGYYSREAAGEPGATVPVMPLIARAEAIWSERYGEPVRADYINAGNYGDANGYIWMRRSYPERQVNQGVDTIAFDLTNGEMIVDFVPTPARQVQRWLAGLHFIQFDHWPLRWFYFVGGLAGCLTIASGFVFWTASRRSKIEAAQPFKVRLIDVVSVGSVTGLIAATCAFFVINRLLPVDASWNGFERGVLEGLFFFLVWILSFLHAGIRAKSAWAEQTFAIAALALGAVLLNWITTGDHPIAAAGRGLWSVAGMDLVLLAGAAIAAWAALELRRSKPSAERRSIDEAETMPGGAAE